jgi:hypothetical protein
MNYYDNLRLGMASRHKETFIDTIKSLVSANRPIKTSTPIAIVFDTSKFYDTTKIFPSKAQAFKNLKTTQGQQNELLNKGQVGIGVSRMFSLV